jgi:hypothetical protein
LAEAGHPWLVAFDVWCCIFPKDGELWAGFKARVSLQMAVVAGEQDLLPERVRAGFKALTLVRQVETAVSLAVARQESMKKWFEGRRRRR